MLHRRSFLDKVAAVDPDSRTVELAVSQVCKGEFAPKKVILTVANDEVTQAFDMLAREGETVVAFVGKKTRRQKDDQGDKVIFYPGSGGRWQIGRTTEESDPAKWLWTKDLDPAVNEQMYGTFNGSAERLAEMMADKARGRYFFPATPFDQFKDDLAVGRFEQPIRGVALYDIDGDGRLDIYACSDGGDRAYLQTAALEFTDSTAALGLEGLKSPSVNFADANAADRPEGTVKKRKETSDGRDQQ